MALRRTAVAIALSIAACGSSPAAGAVGSADAGVIRDEKGLSIHIVDGEAGLHPKRPSAHDQKVVSDEGHAYWLRSGPTLVPRIVEVGIRESDGGRKVWLQVSEDDAKRFQAFTSAHIGDNFAFVFDGEMLGAPVQIMAPIAGGSWELPETNPLMAYARCLRLEKRKQGSTRDLSPSPSNCRLRP